MKNDRMVKVGGLRFGPGTINFLSKILNRKLGWSLLI